MGSDLPPVNAVPAGATNEKGTPMKRAAGSLRRQSGYLLALALVLPSLIWVLLDRSVWPWDQAWYGEVSVELYCSFRQGLGPWVEAMRGAFGSKAPAVAWFGQWFVPIGQLLGSMDLGLHLSVLICQALTLMLVYRIGQRIAAGNDWITPMAGCLLVGGAPLFVGMSHQYFAEPIQTLAVVWILYAAVAAPTWTRVNTLTQLLAAGSVALLAKSSTPAYCLLPGLMAASTLFLRKPISQAPPQGRQFGRWICLLVSVALLAATTAWYQRNLGGVLRHAYDASVGDIALDYGKRDLFLAKMSFWLKAVRLSLFSPLSLGVVFLVAAIGLTVSLSAVVRRREKLTLSWTALLALFSAVHIVGFLAMASRSINEDTRFLMPLLPSLAILFMWALTQIKHRSIAAAGVALLFVQWTDTCGIALGLRERNACNWLIPFDADATKAQEVSRLVARSSQEETSASRYNIVGVESPWLNANTCSYLAAQGKLASGRRPYYTSLGYAERDEQKALRRLEDVNTLYFITREGSFPDDFLNRVSEGVAKKVAQDSRYERQSYASSLDVVIYRRRDILPQQSTTGRGRASLR
jgi:hypothetical protein